MSPTPLPQRRPTGRAAAVAVVIACLLPSSAAGAETTASAADAQRTDADVAATSAMVREGGPSANAADAPGYPWTWPVPGGRDIVEPFRAPAHAYGPGHRGIDIAAAPGADVRAPADGVIAFRGVVVDRPLLTIDHGSGHVTTFEPLESTLAPGDAVRAGQVVGTAASGGHAARGALHIGVRVDRAYVNPSPLFGAVPRAVLLPCCG